MECYIVKCVQNNELDSPSVMLQLWFVDSMVRMFDGKIFDAEKIL